MFGTFGSVWCKTALAEVEVEEETGSFRKYSNSFCAMQYAKVKADVGFSEKVFMLLLGALRTISSKIL